MEGGREGKEEMEEGRQKGREAVDAVTKSQCINNKQLLDYKIPQTEKFKKKDLLLQMYNELTGG